MIKNLIPVKLDNQYVYFNEISFYEYKNICKMLMTDDIKLLNDCFNRILHTCMQSKTSLNIIDKFKILIAIRNTILGNDITLNMDNKKISINLSPHIETFIDNSPIKYDYLTFKSPSDFYTDGYDVFIAQCLSSINKTNIEDLLISQKLQIVSELSLSLSTIYKSLYRCFADRSITIYKNLNINIYNSADVLFFLKNILQEDLGNILQFEHICMQNLNLRAADFKMYTYPELKIFLNFNNKDKSNQEPDRAN
jgi:hypothetical protein